VLGVIPTGDAFNAANMDFSLGFWVWSFLAAPPPVPEELIAASPATLVNHMLDTWADVPDVFPSEVRQTYIDKLSDPDTIHAVCEQYRAAATLDYQHDEADRGRKKIECPVLALWSSSGAIAAWYEPLQVWKSWADDVRGEAIDAGHFLPEEAPAAVASRLLAFFNPGRA